MQHLECNTLKKHEDAKIFCFVEKVKRISANDDNPFAHLTSLVIRTKKSCSAWELNNCVQVWELEHLLLCDNNNYNATDSVLFFLPNVFCILS